MNQDIQQITIIPSDKLIIINNECLFFDFEPLEDNIHAIQYQDGRGHIEYENKPNVYITDNDYNDKIKPYVELWFNEKNRLLEEQKKIEEEYNSIENIRLRKLDELTVNFIQAESNGIIESSVGFSIDATERANHDIDGLIKSLEYNSDTKVMFCAADNSFHEVTLEQLKKMQLEVIQYGQQLYQTKWELRNKILNAQTKDELNNIEIKF